MFRNITVVALICLSLAACVANRQPRIIQASQNSSEIVVTVGMATQIEMPNRERVLSVVTGNMDLVTVEKDGDVVNLSADGDAGETNLIVRARDQDDNIKVYQYHITVQKL